MGTGTTSIRRAALPAALVLGFVVPAYSQDGAVRGVVTDTVAGQPTWPIEVVASALCFERGRMARQDGSYLIGELPPGIYSVGLRSPLSARSGGERVEIRAGDTVVVDLVVATRNPALPANERPLDTAADAGLPRKPSVPGNIEDALAELERLAPREIIAVTTQGTEEQLARFHLDLGRQLRNCWGLWSDSRLAKFFNDLGVEHPDDMSAILLTSFWRHVNKQPLRLDEQIASYAK